jgi:RNA polymerase sigma-70 factor (ECF subfamily)
MTKPALPLVITSGVARPRDDRSDLECFSRLVRGDRTALADLYDAHAGSLFRHALALTRRPGDAEDLVQVVFLKLATTGAALLAVRSPASYLHRILHAAWIDDQRRPLVARASVVGSDDTHRATARPNDLESAMDVARALAQLPAVQREIVQLHVIEGFSFREAGRITRVSMFTAASRYRVALARLRKLMEER